LPSKAASRAAAAPAPGRMATTSQVDRRPQRAVACVASERTALSDAFPSLAKVTFTTDDACAYIAKVRWQFAKTMPQWPHEYTVREWREDLQPEFFGLVLLIRREGVVKPWPPEAAEPRYRHTYLEVGGWEYWTMGEPISETTVINRALITKPRRE